MAKSDRERTRVQSSGKTVEEAIQAGLSELGVARDQVEIELLNTIGADPERPVLVQLSLREDADNSFAPAPSASASPVAVPVPQGAPSPGAAEETMESSPSSRAGSFPKTSEAAGEANLPEAARQVLETLLRGMGIRSQVVIHQDMESDEGPSFVLDIVGADLGILIGRRGETLRDLEYLARLIVASRTHTSVRFAVDVEGYRARRERVLRELAKRMADRVRQSRQPITLEAMPPHERRIVHITLREHTSVKTQSIGEGDRRRVMILPR